MKPERVIFQWVVVLCVGLVSGTPKADENGDSYPYCDNDDPLCENPDSLESSGEESVENNDDGETAYRYQRSDDYDDDGILDSVDKCPGVPSTSDWTTTQKDFDNDGVGDSCDSCVKVFNPKQQDEDGDKIGDACDRDMDGDLVLDPLGGEGDSDSDDADDESGDGDDTDDVWDEDGGMDIDIGDGDGGLDDGGIPPSTDVGDKKTDNCVNLYNPRQGDIDSDGYGDVCDDDVDGDGFPNTQDPCPFSAVLATKEDTAECLGDSDSDTVPNFVFLGSSFEKPDNCPTIANVDQSDFDGDGIGDACDSDMDGDAIPNSRDNCYWKPKDELYGISHRTYFDASNPGQEDRDRDGKGDACDDKFCFVVPKLVNRIAMEEEDENLVWEDLSEEEKEAIREKYLDRARVPTTNLDIDRTGQPRFCLNPSSGEFVVATPDVLGVPAGEPVLLRLFANRINAAIRYEWVITHMPVIEAGEIRNPVGAAGYSTPFEYNYAGNATPVLVPRETGYYVVKVRAEEIFQDGVEGETYTAEASATIYVSGSSLLPASECNCRQIGRMARPRFWARLISLVRYFI